MGVEKVCLGQGKPVSWVGGGIVWRQMRLKRMAEV